MSSRRATEIGIALAVALLGIVLAPGLAVVALVAGAVLVICGASLALGRRARRRS